MSFPEHLTGCRPRLSVQEVIHHQGHFRDRGPGSLDPQEWPQGSLSGAGARPGAHGPPTDGGAEKQGHQVHTRPLKGSSLSPTVSITTEEGSGTGLNVAHTTRLEFGVKMLAT